MLGQPVAQGFREDRHVSPQRLKPFKGEPLQLGQDFGLTPATIIGQNINGKLPIYAALPCAHGGVKQHLEQKVIPWLQAHRPVYDSQALRQRHHLPARPARATLCLVATTRK